MSVATAAAVAAATRSRGRGGRRPAIVAAVDERREDALSE